MLCLVLLIAEIGELCVKGFASDGNLLYAQVKNRRKTL